MKLKIFCALLLASSFIAVGRAQNDNHTLVGAIRWDQGWSTNTKWANNLRPERWHYRLPFYAKVSKKMFVVRSDNQVTMDQEIKYASDAGLDYWAFDYNFSDFKDRKKIGIPLYLTSGCKSKINFCVILLGLSGHAWPEIVANLVTLFKARTYQDVLDGRPLVYWFYVEKMAGPTEFGSKKAAKAALTYLRAEAVKAGLKPPYVVAMTGNALAGARDVDELGFDAISAYTTPTDSRTFERKEYPYSRLAKINHNFWNACKATGKEVIPIVNTGWDVRPRWWDTKLMKLYDGAQKPWFAKATPAEIATNLRDAIEWNKRNPVAGRANAVIIYAWNESDEGGWLVPTISEGTARLKAIKKVIFEERRGVQSTLSAQPANSHW